MEHGKLYPFFNRLFSIAFRSQTNTHFSSNQANLRILEDIGVTPDQSFHDRRPTLKTAALAVRAVIRMKRMQQDWAANEKVHEALIKKLQQTRRQSKRGLVR